MYAVQLDANGGVFRVATQSQDAVWNGDNAAAGAPGDGQSWSQAANWTRGAAVDSPIVAEDHVFFVSGSMQPMIKLEAERLVSAATFNAPYTLQQGTLRVISGNVSVAEDVTATIESELMAETEHRSIRKLGLGTLLVQGNAGQTVVKEGMIGGTGTLDHLTVREGGTVAPGNAIGVLTVDNSFTMHDGARLEIQLGGNDNSDPSDPQYDELVVGGPLNVAGALEVSLFDRGAGMFDPVNGEFFSILSSADEISGSFSDVNLPDLDPGLTWEIDTADNQQLVLRVVALLDADYNADGSVDAADYIVWRDSLDETGRGLAADGTGPDGVPDGQVNDADYQLWRENFGRTIPSPEEAAAANVPEPHALSIAVFGALLTLTSRRRAEEWHRAARRTGHG
jgi:hypothetical protein